MRYSPVIDEEDVSVFELGSHSVEFGADTLPALFLAGHDERSEDVAVLDKGLAVWSVELLGHGECGDGACFGDGDDWDEL